MIVEFFTTVGVVNVPPPLVPYRMVVLTQRRNGDMLPIRFWILKQRADTHAFNILVRRQAAKFDQRRIDTQQLDRFS